MSEGLTFQKDSVKVSVDGTVLDSGYQIVTDGLTDGDTFEVRFTDLKEISSVKAGSKITVAYSAILNSNAIIGAEGNPNKAKLEYSNNPYGDGTGETPEDKVVVFTYELDVTKIDGADKEKSFAEQKKLKDAEFVLYRGTDANPEYAKVDANAKIQKWTNDINNATTLKSDANGLFKVIGLDDGTYYLKETKAPNGYNILKNDIKVQIEANTTNGQNGNGKVTELQALNVKVNDGTENSGNFLTGIVNITVENNQGSILPETGGIGTTIFYIVGVVLVLGAGVLLVTKKRMNADK